MKFPAKRLLYNSILIVAVALMSIGLYSRRVSKIEVQGELLSVQSKTAYFLNASGSELIITSLDYETRKSQEFIRLPASNVDKYTLYFDDAYFYYFQGKQDKNHFVGDMWKEGGIFRVPLTGGKPEQVASNVHMSWFIVLPHTLCYIEPNLPLKKMSHLDTFRLVATDLQTRRTIKVNREISIANRPQTNGTQTYGKGILWTEENLKTQVRFLNLYEPSTSLHKRFGPYHSLYIPFQTRQEAFWITHNTATDVPILHCFDTKTRLEPKTTLSNDATGFGLARVFCGRDILLVRRTLAQANLSPTNVDTPMTVEILDYPFSSKCRFLTQLPVYPTHTFSDDDYFYCVTLEVESSWINFSSDNRLTSKSWLRRVKIPH